MTQFTIRSFGRTRGRALSYEQAGLMGSRLGGLRLNADIANNFDPMQLMPDAKAIWFEIGFGGAEHLIAQALAHRDILFIGAEPFVEGVAKALRLIEDNSITNIRLIDDDARPFLAKLQDQCLDRIFILFPDPWHKKRHNKRRILNENFANELARLLKCGGKLRFATDWAEYGAQVIEIMAKNNNFVMDTNSQQDANASPQDHYTTRYEVKGLGDCKPIFLDFTKLVK